MSKLTFGTLTLALLAAATSAHAVVGAVPEIDGAGAITAIGLLAGVAALVAEKRRQK